MAKQWLSAFLLGLLILGATGCGTRQSTPAKKDEPKSAGKEDKKEPGKKDPIKHSRDAGR